MKICYIDEAGCTGALPTATSDVQPVLAFCGVILDAGHLRDATIRLIDAKRKFFPGLAPGATKMGWILREVKGNDLRKNACAPGRNIRRHTMGYIDHVLDICDSLDIRIVGRVWVKGIGGPLNGMAVYTSSIQSIYQYFNNYLVAKDDYGVVIADARLKHLNTPVAHSIFTQKFRSGGDTYGRIIELPAFSHSDNHAGLQIADLVCSALIFPLAVHTYCAGHVQNIHVRPGYFRLKDRYGTRLKAMQHRYEETVGGRWIGGLMVADAIQKRSGRHLFE